MKMTIKNLMIALGLILALPAQAAMKDVDKKVIILKDCDALEMTAAENKTRDLLIEYMRQVYEVTEENIRLKKELAKLKR